jgi:hypothetical protein
VQENVELGKDVQILLIISRNVPEFGCNENKKDLETRTYELLIQARRHKKRKTYEC